MTEENLTTSTLTVGKNPGHLTPQPTHKTLRPKNKTPDPSPHSPFVHVYTPSHPPAQEQENPDTSPHSPCTPRTKKSRTPQPTAHAHTPSDPPSQEQKKTLDTSPPAHAHFFRPYGPRTKTRTPHPRTVPTGGSSSIVSVYCKCLLRLSIVSVYCDCLLQVPIVSVDCKCLLRVSIVSVYCKRIVFGFLV